MSSSVTIASRFCGPPESGNGGYTAGLLAMELGGGPTEVTLRKPLPLDRPLTVEREGDTVTLHDGNDALATAVRTAVDLAVPTGPVDHAAAVQATRRCPVLLHPEWHPARTCFVCGPDRAEGDGLRIFPGPLADGRYAAPWTPAVDLAGPDGVVRDEFVWAALDCPSSFLIYAGREERPEGFYVMGRMAARIDARPRAGDALIVQAWLVAREGRKLYSASALQRPDGHLLAVARATWIRI